MFFNINRTIVLSVAAGIVVGALGYKFYDKNKQCIDAKLKSLGIANAGCDDGKCDCTPSSSLSVEELEAQKERLEDLIAEVKQSQAQESQH